MRLLGYASPILLTLVALAPGTATAQSYNLTSGFGTLSSIRSSGTFLSATSPDDGAASMTMPFAFSFFGANYGAGSNLTVGVNGAMSFDNPSIDLGNDFIPSTGGMNGFIAAFWQDLHLDTVGALYYQVTGGTGSRVLTVEWADVALYGSRSDKLTFQIRLYEGSNRIEMIYGSQIGTGSGAAAASIGVEDISGTIGAGFSCTPSCDFSSVPSGTLLTFTPGAGPPPSRPDLMFTAGGPLPGSVVPGSSYSLDYTLRNAGSVETSAEVYLMAGTTTPVTLSSGVLISSDFVSGLAAGSSSPRTMFLSLDSSTPDGTYYLALFADPGETVLEADENNNVHQLGSVRVGTPTGGTITITTRTLPRARVGSPYSVQLTQQGGTSPVWNIVSGSPGSGLSLSQSGVLSGTPLSEGTFGFRVEASEAGFASDSLEMVLTVGPAGGLDVGISGPNGLTNVLPQATVGRMYTAQAMAEGGTPPYALQIVSGAPDWMFMNSQGEISGTPSAAGSYSISITAFDSLSNFAEALVQLEVVEGGPLTFETTELPAGVTSVGYDAQLTARGGAQPYQWSISSGQLPAGLSLDGSSGRISGTPSEGGSSSFEITLGDADGASVSRMLSIEVTERQDLVIDVPATIALRFEQEADFQLQARGGIAPYTWRIDGGLPPGVILDGDRLRGTPTSSSARSQVVITVTDRELASQSAEVEIIVNSGSNTGGRARTGGGRSSGGGCVCAGPLERSQESLLWLLALGLLVPLRASLSRRSVVREGTWLRSTIRRRRGARRSSPL